MPSKRTAAEPQDSPSFEQAMEELEEIVHLLEDSQLPLEELVQRYERGTRLLQVCTEKLDAAQQRIELIASRADGSADTVPFDPSQPPPAEPASAPRQRPRPSVPSSPSVTASSDDDIRLF